MATVSDDGNYYLSGISVDYIKLQGFYVRSGFNGERVDHTCFWSSIGY